LPTFTFALLHRAPGPISTSFKEIDNGESRTI